MRSNKTPHLLLVLLLVAGFSLAGWLVPRWDKRQEQRPMDVLSVLMGDSRRLFANHFFVKADAYFHSGFYPTIFDNRESFQTPHMAADAGALREKNEGEETQFMGKPRDFVEEFSRHFLPSTHTHLDQGGAQGDLGESDGGEVREILPWLKLSADLDPNRIETYMVTAYWLRKRMGKVKEAEEFLREGLRANPGNSSLLFELGRIYQEDHKDVVRARNLFEVGVERLDAQKAPKTEQDDFMLSQLTLHLARLEETEGNLPAAIHWLEKLEPVSPNKEGVAAQIAELRQKLGGSGTPAETSKPSP